MPGPPPVTATAPAQEARSGRTVRVAGTIRDLQNAMTLPGATVEVLGRGTLTQTSQYVYVRGLGERHSNTTLSGGRFKVFSYVVD